MDSRQKAIRSTYLSIFGNALLAVIKALTGFFGNSAALWADAIESASDTMSSCLVLLGFRYSTRPADKNHPYGHGRAEPLMSFLITGFLIVSAGIIIVESIDNIRTPHDLPKPFTLVVLGLIIAVKEIMYRIVHRRGVDLQSTTLKADAWHHRSDAITSLTAFVGISIALYFGKGYEAADDWAALLASGVILYNSYFIFRPALGEVMDEHVYDDLVDNIRKATQEVAGVIGTEKCHVRKTGMTFHVDLHVVVDAGITVRQGHDIAHLVKAHLLRNIPQIADVLIHVEPG